MNTDFFQKNTGKIRIRFDLRNINFSEALSGVSAWWEDYSGFKPASVPSAVEKPFYSTWYSYHQFLDEESILEECRKAKELGIEGIFIDDGWQTDDTRRGYAYCGDWKTVSSKIPDIGNLVEKIHEERLKVILWYAVPYAGIYSEAHNVFKDKYLVINPAYEKWFVLDPRYKDVRDFIISHYINAAENWDVDGIKLDFISRFSRQVESKNPFKEGMDFEFVSDAEYALFNGIREKLEAVKPEIMLECRQEYIGPAVRSLGNMMRAEDCPACSLTNRVSIIDIKLLAGKTSVHADPIMWNINDSVESASMQMSNAFFGVPQLSMKLKSLPDSHSKMLSFYLKTWKKWAAVITKGDFTVFGPASNYTLSSAFLNRRWLCVNYSASLIDVKREASEALIVNSSYNREIIFKFYNNTKTAVNVYNCTGEKINTYNVSAADDFVKVDSAPGGIIHIDTVK